MRVLITGVTGMAGSHLAEYLLGLGLEVYGGYRWRSRMENLDDLRREGRLNILGENATITSVAALERLVEERAHPRKLNLIEADMVDPFAMRRLIAGVKPERIFHLAAQSYVPGSWSAPAETLHRNILGQVHLLEAVREAGIDPLIHIAGSSEEYGLVRPEELPIKETNPLRHLSPYAVSKVAQEMLALQYFMSYRLRCVVTRGFNHEGPRRGHVFVTSNLARQIAEIEQGLREPVVYVGDVSIKRDWSDVRDVVRAYWLSLEKGEPGEVYNVGSGRARSVGEMLDMLLSMTQARVEVKVDPARFRSSDVRVLEADVSKFGEATGWQPQIPFEQTLRDILEYWRKRV